MSKGSVVIYKGKFAYDVVNVFSDLVAEGFREAGYECVPIDLTQGASFAEELKAVLRAGSCKAVFSFAGAGAELEVSGGRLLHDVVGVPFVAAMVDHPAHFLKRYALRKLHIGCFDSSHRDYLDLRFSKSKSSFVLPHGGCPPAKPFDGAFEERPCDIVFPASFLDPAPLEKGLSSLPAHMRKTLERAVEISDACDSIPTHLALSEAAKAFGVDCASSQLAFSTVMDPLFSLFEHLTRARRRIGALKLLDEAGLPVDIYGSNWPKGLFKVHRVHEPLGFYETLDLMARSKIVLNMRAIPGPHERVCSAAMAGALCVSDFNEGTAAQFKEGEEIAFFRWTRAKELPELVASLLAAPSKASRVAEASRSRAFAEHRWSQRAKLALAALGLP